VAAYAISLFHVLRLICEHNTNGMMWCPSRRQDWCVQIMMLPAVYGTMSLRCVLRCWTLMTGSEWSDEMAAQGWTWDEYSKITLEDYNANFALANFVESYTLLCFSLLVIDLLKESIKSVELQSAFQNLSMQGVLVFVLVGFAKTLTVLRLAWLRTAQQNDHRGEVPVGFFGLPLEDELARTEAVAYVLDYIVLLTTLQALYNISAICHLSPLQEINPSVKFLGTRILVIFAQFQSFSLDFISSHKLAPLSPYQARLFHASLMCVECAAVALMHIFAWPDDDYCWGGNLSLADPESESSWAASKHHLLMKPRTPSRERLAGPPSRQSLLRGA